MNGKHSLLAVVLVALSTTTLFAETCCCPQCGCQDGCVLVPMKRASCHIEPEVKPVKKIVYETKRIPVCEHRLPPFLHPDCCPQCAACPRYKTVLIKKEIECGEKCKLKCVPEETIVWVAKPCTQCGHRPSHPILNHIFSKHAQADSGTAEAEAQGPFEDASGFEPAHVAQVPPEFLRSQGGGVVTAGALLEPGLIETEDSVESLRQRFINSSNSK